MQREQHAGAVEKERRYCRKYLLINLNLIVDRPDGLIKEGNKRSFCRILLDKFREIGSNKGHCIKFCRIPLADDLLVKVIEPVKLLF